MNKKLLKKKKKAMREIRDRKVTGYHVYRSEDKSLPFKDWTRVTEAPIPDGTFDDPASEHGRHYFYKLTQVFEDGTESAPITPRSTYTDHAGNKFEQNPLVDFVGYNVYRASSEEIPLDQWEKRNSTPIPDNQFKDEGVESGEEFFYYVRAVDSKGNESAPGEIFRIIKQ